MQYDVRERVSVFGLPDQLEVLKTCPSASATEQQGQVLGGSMPESHRIFLQGLKAKTQPLCLEESHQLVSADQDDSASLSEVRLSRDEGGGHQTSSFGKTREGSTSVMGGRGQNHSVRCGSIEEKPHHHEGG